MKNIAITFVVTISLFSTALSQDPAPKPPDQDDPVVKISTDLIQVDVAVTDKNGKVVPDLRPVDFEIFENGEKQDISNFAFLSRTAGGVGLEGSNAAPASPSQAAMVPANKPLTRSAVHRTIAIVIDDLNLSFGSIDLTRKSLRKFVNEQMEPDDLVAIVRTRGGIGALQQFTSDKQILHAAINSLRWNPDAGSFDSLSSVAQNASDVSDRFTRESDLVAGKSKQEPPGAIEDPVDFAV